MLIRKQSGEVIDVDTDEIMEARDFAALIGREDDPVVQALISEIRRLGTVLGNQPQQLAPVVNVSPAIKSPDVNVSPRVEVFAPKLWEVEVTEHFMTGKIKKVLFRAL